MQNFLNNVRWGPRTSSSCRSLALCVLVQGNIDMISLYLRFVLTTWRQSWVIFQFLLIKKALLKIYDIKTPDLTSRKFIALVFMIMTTVSHNMSHLPWFPFPRWLSQNDPDWDYISPFQQVLKVCGMYKRVLCTNERQTFSLKFHTKFIVVLCFLCSKYIIWI